MPTHPLTALMPYLREELETAERVRVARHLAQCRECRDLMYALAAVSADLVRRIEQMPGPHSTAYQTQLSRKLAARLAPVTQRSWPANLKWGLLGAASVAAIVLLLVLGIQRPSMPSVEDLATDNGIADVGLGLLRDYQVVTHLDLLENYDVIMHLNELPQEDNQPRAAAA